MPNSLNCRPLHQHPPADALPVIAVGAVGHGDDRHLGMVDQVLADAGQIGDDVRMPCAAQLIGRADAGQHQELAA